MEIKIKLKQQITYILREIKRPESICGDIDTCTVLYDLASKGEWGREEIDSVNFLSKRLDVNKKLFLGYQYSGRKAVHTVLVEKPWLELSVAIFLKAIYLASDTPTIALKRFNVLFKMLDLTQPAWISTNSEIANNIESRWLLLTQRLPMDEEEIDVTCKKATSINKEQELKVIPLTIMFYEGPIGRAYLETIKSLGYKPKKIIALVPAKDVTTKKILGKWLPKGMRIHYSASIQRSKIHYWPKQLYKAKPYFVKGILDEIQLKLGFERQEIENANSLLPLSRYSDCVEPILIANLSDNGLLHYLSKEPAGSILYTGGGIVPASLLGMQHLKFLHIHPGFLPNIRGADCTLWSTLLTGHASASCFYMSTGIDTGDIIRSCWLPKFTFDVDAQDIDLQSIYRCVYSYLDPWIRAFVLRGTINTTTQLDKLDSVRQLEESGTNFHFMHKRLREISFERLFNFKVSH